MASNNEWAPLPQRHKRDKKQRENQAKVISQLKEMFGSTFESEIITTVAEHSDWELDRSIDTLITLSSDQMTAELSNTAYIQAQKFQHMPQPADEFFATQSEENSPEASEADFLNMDENELIQQQEELRKFEQAAATNKYTSSEDINALTRKVETASLCGLKVEYRPKGMENNSDDDADVVIEDESSDYRVDTPEIEPINVCHFLSNPTQCPPKTTFPKVDCISTPSPPCSPRRQLVTTVQDKPSITLTRIEKDLKKGYKVLILMRGVPGCGKSFLAKSIVTKCANGDFTNHIFSADDYFLHMNRGVYIFDPSKLSDAHSYNQNRVLNAMRLGVSPIIVDNTNTQAWEMKPYAAMAIDYGYIVETLEPHTPWSHNVQELEKRNQHNVPRAQISKMLNRYEPNISGDRLLRMFSLRFTSRNRPPQLRKLPSLQQSIAQKNPSAKNSPKLTQKSEKIEEPEELIEDVVIEQIIDNNSLSTIAKEYANLEVFLNNSNKNNTAVIPNESWTAGTSFKEDNQFDLMKLGAIGSERKVSSFDSEGDEDVKLGSEEEIRNESSPTLLRAIGSERKNSIHALDDRKFDPDGGNENVLSQCWDFTMTVNGTQIHSKLDDDAAELEFKDDKPIPKKTFMNDGDVTFIVPDKDNGIAVPKTDVANKLDDVDIVPTEPSTPSDNTSNNSSDFERVDIPQLETAQKTIVQSDKSKAIVIREDTEKQSSGGFGSIFSFIKNSLLGSDKDNAQQKTDDNEETAADSMDRLTEKLRNMNSSSSGDTSSDLSSILIIDQNDTLTCKFSDLKIDNHSDKNLSYESQGSVDFCDVPATELKMKESMNPVDESKEDEFFEAQDILDIDVQAKESVANVIEELREACTDFQLIEAHDFTEEKPKFEDVFYKENICDVLSEKIFVEQLKNLTEHTKSGDQEKMSKEPINIIFDNEMKEAKSDRSSSPLEPTSETNESNVNFVNNINLITWQESPFPVDEGIRDTVDSGVAVANIEINSKKCDRETYTDPYDFNVAYVGGIEGFKILEARDRAIIESNQSSPIHNAESPPTKRLMLHKGTMTNTTSVFYKETIFDLEIAAEEDRSDELVERYSLLPSDCVLDIYKNLCKGDFNWAVDYLNNLLQEDEEIQTTLDQIEAENTKKSPINEPEVDKETESHKRSESSPSENDLQQSKTQARGKRGKHKKSEETLELERELESKFVLSEESYPSHILQVKRWKNRDFSDSYPTMEPDDLIYFENHPVNLETSIESPGTKKLSRLDHPAAVDDEEFTEEDDSFENQTEPEEMMELKLGYEFIQVLESHFGNSNFQVPDGLFPVIQIRKSVAQELHALWIESMQQQLWVMQEQLDAMIAKDAEFAKSIEDKVKDGEEDARGPVETEVPNLKEIMDMEMAMATYSNYSKRKLKQETNRDMELRVAKQNLIEMFPNYDREMICEIFEAHDRNFDETVKVIEENCSIKSTLTMADILKKRKDLIDELQKESDYQTSNDNQLETQKSNEASGGNYEEEEEEEPLTYEGALGSASDSRMEARRQLALRNENYRKAAEHIRRKNPEVAAYYSNMAKLHIRKMEKANSAAASAFLAAQAHFLESDDTLDLHFLHVAEALQALQIYLDHQFSQLSGDARKYIFIITGRGARSINGQSKIKPAVTKELNRRNLRFSEVNPGMLKVLLRKR